MSVIHICGFYADDRPRLDGASVTVCPDGETPYTAFVRVRSNIHHFGGELDNIRHTWPLGERRLDANRIEFESPAHGAAARMWHVITLARPDEWKAKP